MIPSISSRVALANQTREWPDYSSNLCPPKNLFCDRVLSGVGVLLPFPLPALAFFLDIPCAISTGEG